jgi:hypothetical protein
MPLKDVEARRSYERAQRKKERLEIRKYRAFKLKLKSCSNLDGKVNALLASPNFNDVGAALQLLVTS